MTDNAAPQRYCTSCGRSDHGSLACSVLIKTPEARAADTALLEACREELLSQWESNHAEHCNNILPCMNPMGCQWPQPDVLARLSERELGVKE